MSEPAILVKRKGKGSQVWSMDKLENKLIDMRDLYGDGKEHVSWFFMQSHVFIIPLLEFLTHCCLLHRTRMMHLIHFTSTLKIIT